MDTSELKVYLKTALQQMIDNAGSFNGESGFTVVLENTASEQVQYHDAPLFSGQTLAIRPPGDDTRALQTAALRDNTNRMQKAAADQDPSKSPKAKKYVPEQIRRMRNLYQHGDGSFRQQRKNFYVQGKFMENYEDPAAWDGEIYEYWPSYYKLSLAQLRGYFTWRTELRKGNYRKHCDSFVLMYLSELVNEIGTTSAEESFLKIQEFEKNYIDAGLCSGYIQYNIQQWMFEFAVVNGLAPEIACRYADREVLERDAGIEILHNPKAYSDQEVFDALCIFAGEQTAKSKLIQLHGAEAISLFAAMWRLIQAQYRRNGKDIFRICFGRRGAHSWYPLNGTLYYEKQKREEITYELNSSRFYRFKRGEWRECGYQMFYFDKRLLTGLLKETDRRLRLYLKTGHPLKERKEAAWAVPYIEAVIEADRKAKLEAARPNISIDFSGLDKIRKDALETQSNLLTEEETQCTPEFNAVNKAVRKSAASKKHTKEDSAARKNTAALLSVAASPHLASEQSEAAVLAAPSNTSVPLDGMQIQLLQMLLRGESVQELITAQRGMPSVIADAINEALFDYIGDTVVECDGETITIIEDYREGIINILKEE